MNCSRNHSLIRIFGFTALVCAAVICCGSNAQAALVGWWNLDEGTGTNAADSSATPAGGSANDGTLVNIANSNWDSGLSGATDGLTMPHGLRFDGHSNQNIGDTPDGDHVELDAHTADFQALTQGSISMWFRRDIGANPNDNALIGFGRPADNNYIRIQVENGNEFRINENFDDGMGTSTQMSATYTDDGNWHHVVFASNGTTSEFFVDGTSVATGTQGFIDVAVTQMALGFVDRKNRPLWYYDGTLGDVRIYDTVLTQSEIDYVSDAANYGDGQVVPEPSTIVLLLLGAVGFLAVSRKRKN